MEISRKKKWDQAHKILNDQLAKEIKILREMLSNLHQEELALLENRVSFWKKLRYQMSDLVLEIFTIREDRMLASIELTKCCVLQGQVEMLPHSEESSCDILSKLDQLIALLERINLQNCRNGALFHQRKEHPSLPLQCSYPHPLHKVKKKTRVATYLH